MKNLSQREKAIMAGLYLSKFDKVGLRKLDFESFTQAFNVIGLALGIKPMSIKNYRDEFDPIFPNSRLGRHKREMRENCRKILTSFESLKLKEFTKTLKKAIYQNKEIDFFIEETAGKIQDFENSSFAKRLLTGQSAENYFKKHFTKIDTFKDCEIEDTTKLGCGFDFKLQKAKESFFGVEVKGLTDSKGDILLTEKEHKVAGLMKNRYFLFIVKNFREKPFHEIYRNPLKSKLKFQKIERLIKQVNWKTNL